jgi:hypothetical protein
LHNEEDFARMRSHKGREPWKSGWDKLITNRYCSLNWKPAPVEVVIRGRAPWLKEPENYRLLFQDAAAAYACALRWKISHERGYAEKAVEILNAWSAVLKRVTGSSDAALAAGLQGYQFANAGEIMRTYNGWKPADFERFPYKEYRGSTEVSPAGRGMLRPGWELVYNHYVIRKRLSAPWTTKMVEKVRPEGGGDGPNSGGYDQLGYGTLTALLDQPTEQGR